VKHQLSNTDIEGVGLGLRSEHYQEILQNKPKVPWFEALSDNYMGDGGLPLHHLNLIRNDYPITLHGVGMSLGSTDPLNLQYMAKLKRLIQRFEPTWVSDHLAWVSVNQHYAHELLPLPYTDECVTLLSDKINQAQDFLGQRLLVENPSSYLAFTHSTKDEAQLLNEVVANTDCYLLIDINNVYVSAQNNGFNAENYIDQLPMSRVKEIHLAGYEQREGYLFDTHGYQINEQVWQLYQYALSKLGPVPTLIEWDNNIPSFDVLQKEASKAQHYLQLLTNGIA